MINCWCGNIHLEPYSLNYLYCPACCSLVSRQKYKIINSVNVTHDDFDFYGKNYYLSHLPKKYGYPDLTTRVRMDLPERCLYWLRALLKYKLPPAKVLELGSAHGGFVALLNWAGYKATGLELSPWLVDFARRTFSVRMFLGTVEKQDIKPASLDVIALMDVLEHLANPTTTIQHCFNILKPDGILLIQTPFYQDEKSYKQMQEEGNRFLEQLKEEEHLHLFSKKSINEFFNRMDAKYIEFQSAIFAHYDMLLVVSRKPFKLCPPEEREKALISKPLGRMVQALLDVDQQLTNLRISYEESEADRKARFKVINELGERLKECQADREARLKAINELEKILRESETDREARLEVIKEFEIKIKENQDTIVNLKTELNAIKKHWIYRLVKSRNSK